MNSRRRFRLVLSALYMMGRTRRRVHKKKRSPKPFKFMLNPCVKKQISCQLERIRCIVDSNIIKEIESDASHFHHHVKHIHTRALQQLLDMREKELKDIQTQARQLLNKGYLEIIEAQIKKQIREMKELKTNETRAFEQLMDEIEKDGKKTFERLNEGWEKVKVKCLELIEEQSHL